MPKLTIFTNEWSFYSGSLVNPRSITLSGSAFAVSSSLGMPYLKTVDLPMNAFSKKKTAHTYSAPLFSHSHIDIGALNKYFNCSLSFTNKPPPHTPTIPPHAKPNSPFSPSIIPFKLHNPCFPQQRDDLHALAFVLPSNSIHLLQSPTQRIPTSATCWPWVLRELPRLRY